LPALRVEIPRKNILERIWSTDFHRADKAG
jgi:hypothetical protein